MITRERAIVNACIAIKNKGRAVFNDPIVNGRSIKVWGWGQDDYKLAIDLLTKAGFKVKLRNTGKCAYHPTRLTWRIHVKS